jgi:drug/metabolite transporter (DMT)-like permease
MTDTRHSTILGTLYCVLSALGYVAFNVCLRFVSDKEDSVWINSVQASVGAGVFGVYLAWQAARGRPALPPWRELLALSAIGLVTQIGGILTIWAMSVVGVGITGTLQMGVMLAVSAILGRIVLGELVSWRQIAAIAMITLAIVFFSMGAQSAGEATPDKVTPLRVLLGIAAAVLGGVAFAVLTVGIRKTVTTTTSPEAVVFLINVMGVVAFGPWCVYWLGPDALIHTPLRDFGVMVAAGFMNLVGFLMITISLKLIPVVHVNVINNGLVSALTVLAGIAMFAEPWNRDIALGILLSIVGTLLISLVPPAEDAAADGVEKQVDDTTEILSHENPPP